LFERPDLLGDIAPVVWRDLLPCFIEQIPKVMQAGDRRATAVIDDGGIFAQTAEQDGPLNIDNRNAPAMKFGCELLVSGRESTLNAPPFQERTSDFADIRSLTGNRRGKSAALIRPETIGDLDDSIYMPRRRNLWVTASVSEPSL
jgi:hypothetical protein